ncbi:MAG: hypothetical protein CMO11_03335 [Thaumarchaeota archaeon]|nr:hypothetical protein [Nitrososphaerota archaeon]|tara:strand:+ start:684 stop:1814 length:1131 start_codon:yes stop_codon:yes gene_type:complete
MNKLSSLNEEIEMIKEVIQNFGENEINPIVSDIDSNSELPISILEKVSEFGLYGMLGSSEFGGAETSFSTFIHGMLELTKYSPALSSLLIFHNILSVQLINKFGTDSQKSNLLTELTTGKKIGTAVLGDDGSFINVDNIRTEATEEGDYYSISGTKSFVLNGALSDFFIVLCNFGKDSGLVLVEKDNPDISFSKPISTIGLNGNELVSISFYSCKVPKTNLIGKFEDTPDIIKIIQETIWLGISAISIGIMQSALDQAIKYSNEREQFSKRISKFEAIQHKIASIALDIEAASAMLGNISNNKDNSLDVHIQAAMIKIASSEMAQRNTKFSLLIHGGYGYIKDYPVERFVRDAEAVKSLIDSNDDLRVLIAKHFTS